jgi:hypothetical protein
VGFEAERIGNCAFHFGVPNGIVFDKIRINSINGPSGAPGYGSCGLFFSGPAYKTNFGTKFEVRYTDYGVVVGTSNYYNAVIPLEVTAIDDTTNTLTVNNTYVANNQVVLIWDNNDGSLTGINRRSEKLYVVNPTVSTIQVSKTAGGAPVDFSVTGTPQVWVFPSGADTLEFSCDEWSSQQLTTVTNRVGFSGVNHARCTFGELDCQSNAVAFRLLSYQSANYFSSHNIFISDLYTEGPGFTTYMVNKDFVLIEGYEVVINNGPMCNTTAVLNNNVTFKTYESQFYNVGAKNNYLQLLGNRNTIGVLSESGESLIKNYGTDNVLTFCRRSNGDAPTTPRVISKYSLNKPLGGFWPDYIATGNSTTPYQSNQVLMQLAIELQFQSAPVIEYRYDDTTLDVNGYVRKTASGTLAMRYAFGKNSESFAAGKYFPSSRWRLYAKVRSVAAQNLTVGFSQTGGGTTYNGSSVTNVGTSWTTIFVDLNHTGAPAGSTGDLYVTGASGAFDLAYVYILPYNGETFSLQNNYGGGLIDAAGTGSPDAVLTAAIGSTFRRRDGIAGASFYVKQTGTGNTGWVAIG